jgi:hypothetical protein
MRAVIAACLAGWLVALFAVGGNRVAGHRGRIPLGQWSGRGICVYEWWDASAPSPVEEAAKAVLSEAPGQSYEELPLADEDAAEPPGPGTTIHRRYATTLTISEVRLDHREVVVLDIRSRRGPLPQLGSETHALVMLEQTKQLSPATALYRLLGFAFNPETEALPAIDEMAPPCSASCTTLGDTTVLQIRYLDDFVDILRFEGSRLEKIGMYHARGGLVHWAEQLDEH